MLTKNASLLSKESADLLLANETSPQTSAYPPLNPGQVYISAKDDSAGFTAAYIVNNGEFIANATELAAAQARQAALAAAAPVYDVVTGNKYVYSAGAWSLASGQTLWLDYPVGTILFNPYTHTSYYYMYAGSALRI